MKTKRRPCRDNKHDFTDYSASWSCSEDLCRGNEYHCRRCGWYISECLCGSSNGYSKISDRQQKAIYWRQRSRLPRTPQEAKP